MGNKEIRSGGEEIARAKELFYQSLEAGDPDFRFVALAIGNTPTKPPNWAVLECRFECERTARRTSSKHESLDMMLDAITLAYIQEMVRRDDDPELRDPKLRHKPPSFREMVRRAHKAAYHRPLPKSAESDAYKQYERKWRDEQQNAAIESYHHLFDLKITPRIEAAMNHYVGTEMDLFPNPTRAALIMQTLARSMPDDN